jgi:hypothetical protein
MLSSYDQLHKFTSESTQIVRYVYFRSFARSDQDMVPLKTKVIPLGEVGRGFFDALRGVITASKERDRSALFVKLYRNGDPKDIIALSEKFKQEAYRPTTDEYERGFLVAWEIALKTLAELKANYPEYPLKDEQPARTQQAEAEDAEYEIKPRKRSKVRHATAG